MCLEGIIINVWFSLQCHGQDVCSDIGCELYVKDCCDIIVSASEWNELKMGHSLYILSVLNTSSWKWDSNTIQFANSIFCESWYRVVYSCCSYSLLSHFTKGSGNTTAVRSTVFVLSICTRLKWQGQNSGQCGGSKVFFLDWCFMCSEYLQLSKEAFTCKKTDKKSREEVEDLNNRCR